MSLWPDTVAAPQHGARESCFGSGVYGHGGGLSSYDGSGQLSAVGVGFGGPLGADDDTEVTEVVVPLDRLRLSQDGHLTGDLSESDLAQLPEWDN
jgi:hypothetical protein